MFGNKKKCLRCKEFIEILQVAICKVKSLKHEKLFFNGDIVAIKSYMPFKFESIKSIIGISSLNYFAELAGRNVFTDFNSKHLLFKTANGQYLVQQVSKRKKNCLKHIIDDYINYLTKYPNTFISKVLGLYKITHKHYGTVDFIIIDNLLPPNITFHRIYELKGLLSNENTDLTGRVCLKDLDWSISKQKLFLEGKRIRLLRQLENDTRFLRGIGIMNYSLVIGICNSHDIISSVKISELLDGPKPSVISSEGAYKTLEEVYYIGIIDILTIWDTRLSFMELIDSILCRCESEKVEPIRYRYRFMKMVMNAIFYSKKIAALR